MSWGKCQALAEEIEDADSCVVAPRVDEDEVTIDSGAGTCLAQDP